MAEPERVHWEKVHVFISSTFNDMHAERDYLIKRVFPELQDWCERRKLQLVDIDLRWGVTERDASSKRAVRVCLERINDCRPFFLCFLGQRHGWTPGAQGISQDTFEKFPDLRDALHPAASVTELEIRHAILKPFASRDSQDPNRLVEYQQAECAFFYFRDPGYLSHLPGAPRQVLCTYTDDVGPADESDCERNQRELSRRAASALRTLIVTATDADRRVVYGANWRPDLSTPELAMPLEPPSVEETNLRRWRDQWNRFAHLDLAETNSRIPEAEQSAAHEYNAALTGGRLSEIRSVEEARGQFPSGTDLARIIQYDLQQAIEARYPNHVEVQSVDDLRTELDHQEQFLFINSEGFIEREGDFDELESYVAGDSNRLFVLTAPGGMGKTVLLANWVGRYRAKIESEPDKSIHFRFIGASDRSTTVYSLLRYLLREIKGAGKFEEEVPDDPIKLRQTWLDSLDKIGKRGKTVIVIDALNQLETGLTESGWLPQTLPGNIKLIVSFKRDQPGEKLDQRWSDAQVTLSEVSPFEELDDRRRLVKAYLSQYLKELDENHLEALIKVDGASNPLYLKVVLAELRVFGGFANLGVKIRGDFGDSPVTAFQAVLQRLETDPAYSPIEPKKAVPLLFGLLAHARHGLSANELTDLLIEALELEKTDLSRTAISDTINLFFRQVRPFLARREGRYDFFYESFKVGAQERYIAKSPEDQLPKRPTHEWHRYLAWYFGARGLDYPRTLTELAHHLGGARQWVALADLLSDRHFLEKTASRLGASIGRTGGLIAPFLKECLDPVPTEVHTQLVCLAKIARSIPELSASLELRFVRGAGSSDTLAKCPDCAEAGLVHGHIDLGGVDYYDNYFSWCPTCLWAWHAEDFSTSDVGLREFDAESGTYKG